MSNLKIDLDDKTIEVNGLIYFLKGSYANGFLLGFYTMNPCGSCRDQDTGWAVFDPEEKTIIDECETRCFGISGGNDWADWMKSNIKPYGKLNYFTDGCGRHVWKMHE